MSTLTSEARQRLETVEQFSELGSGFNIAMRDLDIRGAGNMLGAEQSGFIADIGFDTYHKILDEAVQELKKSDFRDLYDEEMKRTSEYVKDVTLETDIELMFPDDYVRSTNERMSLYAQLNELKTEEELLAFRESLVDRFGQLPEPAENLFDAIRLQWQAKRLAMDRLYLKGGRLQCYFVPEEDSPFFQSETFTSLLNFLQANPARCKLRQKATMFSLVIEDVHSLNEARLVFSQMADAGGIPTEAKRVS
jgi:transcription-repair coupling factor (superfamily II helicase)